MRVQEWIFRSQQKLRRIIGTAVETVDFDPANPWTDTPPSKLSGELEAYFWRNKGRAIDKWLHYLPIYERRFATPPSACWKSESRMADPPRCGVIFWGQKP